MVSPVPKHLRTKSEEKSIPLKLRRHKIGLRVNSKIKTENCPHPAKYAPGLATALLKFAGVENVADPMAGSGRLASETGAKIKLNEPDLRWFDWLMKCNKCKISCCDARNLPSWFVADTFIFSPPYYPRTDRRKLAAHNDQKRGKVVGYRSGYGYLNGDSHVDYLIGDPGGADGILKYRTDMREIYNVLSKRAKRMILVVKNQTRLGVELRLDLDTILTANEAGWVCTNRTGWEPPPSLWARYNLERGTGVEVEDVLVFERR
jgi:hypothetical protein